MFGNYKLVYSFSLILICFSLKSFSQEIYKEEILYSNSISSFLEIDDELLQKSVRLLFSNTTDERKTVLAENKDTTYYNSLMSLLFVNPNRDWYKIILHKIEKDTNNYLLTCIIQYQVPKSNIIGYIGKVTLPFYTDRNKQIFFLNYFDIYSKRIDFKHHKEYVKTTADNKKNLKNIYVYTKVVKERYNFKLPEGKPLYYTFFMNDSPYKVLGLSDYSLSHQGRIIQLDSAFLILDKKGHGFYKHEISHFVSQSYITSFFFNEGFASYLGGSTSKCDNICDYEKLKNILIQSENDDVFKNIIEWKVVNGVPVGAYYYQLASFTCYLLEKKYGVNFIHESHIREILKSNSISEIIYFIRQEFLFPDIDGSLRLYYLEEIKHYFEGKNIEN